VTRVRERPIRRRSRPRAQRSWGRLPLTLLLFFTFAVQSYVTQTHVHFSTESDRGGAFDLGFAGKTKVTPSQTGDRHNSPAKDDPANCPLCQQVSLAGAFVSPAVVVLYLPMLAGTFALPALAAVAASVRASHNWQGRAPPAL